jgi:hypothetical protein
VLVELEIGDHHLHCCLPGIFLTPLVFLLSNQAIKGLPREKIQLATKFANSIHADGSFSIRGDPEYVRKACEDSLQRLGVDYIDLYYQHRVDKKTPIEATVCTISPSWCSTFVLTFLDSNSGIGRE